MKDIKIFDKKKLRPEEAEKMTEWRVIILTIEKQTEKGTLYRVLFLWLKYTQNTT